ncbi:MAG: NUDIX hydrolase [Nanoarchaeota archaeon]
MSYRNPPTAVDVVIEVYKRIPKSRWENYTHSEDFLGLVLIERGHEPYKGKWALPGGFQEWGESLEETAVREAKEETSLDIELLDQLRVYSNPDRDPRGPVNSVGYIARTTGTPKAGDDAKNIHLFKPDQLPLLAFDHPKRIREYLAWRTKADEEREKKLTMWK